AEDLNPLWRLLVGLHDDPVHLRVDGNRSTRVRYNARRERDGCGCGQSQHLHRRPSTSTRRARAPFVNRSPMRALKFGGSSLSTPAMVRRVADILIQAAREEPVVAVVSAFQGVTNQLIECARKAEQPNASYLPALDRIAKRHRAAVLQLVGPGKTRARG